MKKIFVGGGFIETISKQEQIEFARSLGREVINQGHVLLNGCMTDFDSEVCRGAAEEIKRKRLRQDERISCYVLSGQKPIHEFGTIRHSKLSTWNLGEDDLYTPEPIRFADAIILVGGFAGTYQAANWARLSNKPLLPVTKFGGTSENVYFKELEDFDSKYSSRLSIEDYQILASISSNLNELCQKIVSLAELISTPTTCFVVMSFKDSPELTDSFEAYKEVCREFKYECIRMDFQIVQHVIPEMLKSIKDCGFVIVDISEPSHNVYFELGFAHGLGKEFIITAHKATELPFDIRDLQILFWDSQTNLKKGLRSRIKKIAKNHGRE